MNERPIPPAALRDSNSWEILRAWIAEEGLHVSIRIGAYEKSDIPEEKAWGIILADIARHVSRGLSQEVARGNSEILNALARSFCDEIEVPTSGIEGEFVN